MKKILPIARFIALIILIHANTLHASGATITAISTGDWSASAWPNTTRSGMISSSVASAVITGVGTSFLSQVSVGNIIKNASNAVIGTVLTVNSNTSITLTSNATSDNTVIAYNVQGIGSGDAAVIPGGFTVTMDKSGGCTSLSIGSGGAGNAALVFNLGTQLKASGTVSIGAVGQTGSINMTNGGTLISRGFVINNAGSWIPGAGTIELNGPNTLPNDFFAGVFNNLTVSGQATLTSGSLSIGGNLNIPDAGGGGSVFSTGFPITVTGTTKVGGQPSGSAFLNFTSAAGDKIFNGLVTVGNGGTWDNSTANSPVIFHGGVSSSGDFFAGTALQTFNTNNQTVSGSMAMPNILITGVTLLNNSQLTIGTALDGTGTLTQGVNATLNINFAGTPAISHIVATATGNLVNYGASLAQTVFPTNYYYLTLSNAGVKTLQTVTSTVAGDLSIKGTASTSGVADLNVGGSLITTANASFDGGGFNVSIAGYLSNAGSFTGQTGSVVHVGLDMINAGIFNAGDASVTEITGNIFNKGTFNGDNGSFLYIGGNASNTGILNAGANSIVFNGSMLQTFTNTGSSLLNNITMDNSSDGLQMKNDISIPGTLSMVQGNIDLNGHHLQIGVSTIDKGTLTYTSGTITGVGSVERWFDTSPISDGSPDGLFPVGTIYDYHPFYVSTPTGPTVGGSLTLNYHDIPDVTPVSIFDGSYHIEALDKLNWEVAAGDGLDGGEYNLRIEGTGYGTFVDIHDLRIALAASVVGTQGMNAGTVTDPQINRMALTSAELSNTFFIGFTSGITLHFSLNYFKAYPFHDQVKLDWETSVEINIDHFTILRSAGGSKWEVVKQVPGLKNSNSHISYTALDEHPYQGVSYYKLQQTDVNGKFSYSEIVSVNMGQSTTIAIYPNPAKDQVFVTTADSEKIDFQLYNAIGQLIQVSSEISPNSIRINISSLPVGVYYLHTIHQGIKKVQPIIKY